MVVLKRAFSDLKYLDGGLGLAEFFVPLPAIGTDLWPKWVNYAITEMGSLIVGYNLHSPSKVYLSFTDVCDLLERAGFKICNGPTLYDLPRGEYPGGIVRNWLGVAINNN